MQININIVDVPDGFDAHSLLREMFHHAQYHFTVLETVVFGKRSATIVGVPAPSVGQVTEVVPF